MGHGNQNALYVRASEHSGAFGRYGASSGSASKTAAGDPEAGFKRLSYDCCAISFQPWKHPVASKEDGTIFELTNVIPYIKKYGTNPATGKPLQMSDLLTLHFHTNEKGNWHDPVAFKEFSEHSHIVAIATTGNVYSWDTIEKLNIKVKNWSDLMDESTKFTRKDIITLQDPHNPESKSVQNLAHIKEGKTLTAADRGKVDTTEINLNATGSTGALLTRMRAAQGKGQEEEDQATTAQQAAAPGRSVKQDASSSNGTTSKEHLKKATTTGMMAASFTSSSITPRTINERTTVTEEEYMFEQISKTTQRAYVRLSTNFGHLNLELFVDKAPKTCYNFLTHCKEGYYDNTIFHRNIPGFMIQGGDPTGTGKGGESIWGKVFRDEIDAGSFKHESRGMLSMANKGPGTNGSQFFITYRATPHLNNKHTVFGRLLGPDNKRTGQDDPVLRAMEDVPTEPSTNRPLRSIRILDAAVFEDPFETFKEKLENKLKRENMTDTEKAAREAKRRKREEDRTTWMGTNLNERSAAADEAALKSAVGGVGKYLGSGGAAAKKAAASNFDLGVESANKKRKTGDGGFGDFSSW